MRSTEPTACCPPIGGSDDLTELAKLATRQRLFFHVDAAWAGSAMICPEFRELFRGAESADSIVINPLKWLGVPMERSLHLVKDPDTLVKTLAIRP